jgi:tetratricopeptide (TPR) repeat protein
MKRLRALAFAVALLIGFGLAVAPQRAASDTGPAVDCFSEDIERRIEGCTELIERGDQTLADMSLVYAMRALAYALTGRYEAAIRDYDVAIGMKPDFAAALNNRAWAYFRWGKGAMGLDDVERSLQLSPYNPTTLDTRAHIYHSLGRLDEALHDYNQAMFYGGATTIKLYQCGLTEARLYTGEIDGTWRPELARALERCVRDKTCDPLPADEHCRAATS